MSKPKYIDADKLAIDLQHRCDVVCPYTKAQRDVMCRACLLGDAIDTVEDQPAADVVEVVRCADCKYQEKGENECEAWNLCGYRPWLHIPTEDDAFCSKGERKDG